jgi:hypothetical protein
MNRFALPRQVTVFAVGRRWKRRRVEPAGEMEIMRLELDE